VSTPTHLRTAGIRRVPVAAVLLLLVALVLGGCRSADRAAAPATPAAGPASTGSRTGISTDPLADVEATVGAVERDADIATDADAGAVER
jgi:type IV pilus biogenesis protein CpaD/CtpE